MELESFLSTYESSGDWNPFRTERTEKILSMILPNIEGDLLEIGAHAGSTTKILCETGSRFNRKVFVIDPWDGRQEGTNETYESFKNNCAQYSNLTTIRRASQDQEILSLLGSQRFSYILIDGLHEYSAVKHDFITFTPLLNSSGIICVDDWQGPYSFCLEVRKAINDSLSDNFKLLSSPDNFIERYVLKW